MFFVVLAGDCRCNFPGHNAMYRTYTIMEAGSDLERIGQRVVTTQLVQCTMI